MATPINPDCDLGHDETIALLLVLASHVDAFLDLLVEPIARPK